MSTSVDPTMAALPPHYAAELVALARRGGLDDVGVCTARPFDATRATLEARKAAGLHATMQFTYRDPARSTDPGVSLRGARSLIVGALGYRCRDETANVAGPARGEIGAYAWKDYYSSIRSAFEPVVDRLRADGHRAVIAVDDNQLVDRAAVVRAGLGSYGKNANVLVRGRGSWFVFGSVITDAALVDCDPEPVADQCGPCHRCIDNCPTGAIIASGVVDARRCLSWLLQAESFPAEFREALGTRFYGCDDCQEVCPPNRRADASAPVADHGSVPTVDLIEILNMSDEALHAQFGRLYFANRNVDYLRRNALLALGNSGAPLSGSLRSLLARFADHSLGEVRDAACWAASRLDEIPVGRRPE